MPPRSDSDDDYSDGEGFNERYSRRDNDDDDGDFDFNEESYESSVNIKNKGPTVPGTSTVPVQNQPWDETVDLTDEGSDNEVMSSPEPSPKGGKSRDDTSQSPTNHELSTSQESSQDDYDQHDHHNIPGSNLQSNETDSEEEEDESTSGDEEDDDDEDHHHHVGSEGAYNPSDYAGLNVSPEIQQLFEHIGRYKPHQLELETHLKPFIPDYIPAVGEVDAFLKIPRPDGQASPLGLHILDEPALNQSDPTVLDLQLRAISKQSNLQPMQVRSIENAHANPKQISAWISSISDLHRSKPPPTVQYSKAMPDIESLMQVWPGDFEDALNSIEFPSSDIDMDIGEYSRMICSLLDIPVHGKTVESLHVLFTLYSEFRANQHFNQSMGGGLGSSVDMSPSAGNMQSMNFE